MACSKTIQDSVNWVATILKQQPLNVSNWEPGLTFANLVLGRGLGPPRKGRFNRGNINFGISTAGGTDYSAVVGDLGGPNLERLGQPRAEGLRQVGHFLEAGHPFFEQPAPDLRRAITRARFCA